MTNSPLDEEDDRDGRRQRLAIAAGCGVLLLGGVALAVWYLLLHAHGQVVVKPLPVQQISLVQPPPPPPPPELPEPEPEPEPEEVVEEPEPEPEPEPAPAPEAEAPPDAGDPLAGGEATGDGLGFGLRAGQARIGGGGGGGNALIWYGQRASAEIGQAIERLLRKRSDRQSFSVIAQVWIEANGQIKRAELINSTGNAEIDDALRAALNDLQLSITSAPPPSMPQPLKIRLNARA